MYLFMPKILKEIFTHLPTIIFKSVNIKEILTEAGPFILGFSKKTLNQDSQKSLEPLIEGIFTISKSDKDALQAVDGENILKLYFTQFLNPQGLVLDMRAQHFSKKYEEHLWIPNNTWYQFKNPFRQALINLYIGFYTDNDELYTLGLKNLGLTEGLSEGKINELKSLFTKHFGFGDQSQVSFNLNDFNDSFSILFKFFIENEIKIKTDFIFLGVYLITLYQNLELKNSSYDVRAIVLEVFDEEIKKVSIEKH